MVVTSHDASLDLALAEFYELYGECDSENDNEENTGDAREQRGKDEVKRSKRRKKKSDPGRGKEQPSTFVEPDLEVVSSLSRKERKQVQAPARAASSRLLRQAQGKKLTKQRSVGVLQSVQRREPQRNRTPTEAADLDNLDHCQSRIRKTCDGVSDDVVENGQGVPQSREATAPGPTHTYVKPAQSSRTIRKPNDKQTETIDAVTAKHEDGEHFRPTPEKAPEDEATSPGEQRSRSPRHRCRSKDTVLADMEGLESKGSPKRDSSHRVHKNKSHHPPRSPPTSSSPATQSRKSRRKYRSPSPTSTSRRNVLSAKSSERSLKTKSDSNHSAQSGTSPRKHRSKSPTSRSPRNVQSAKPSERSLKITSDSNHSAPSRKSPREHRSKSPTSRSPRDVQSAKPSERSLKITSDSNHSASAGTKSRQTRSLRRQRSIEVSTPSISPVPNKEEEPLSDNPPHAMGLTVSSNKSPLPSMESTSPVGPELSPPDHLSSAPLPLCHLCRQQSLPEEINSLPLPKCHLGRQQSLPVVINSEQNSPKRHDDDGTWEPNDVSPKAHTQSGQRSKLSSREIDRSQSERRNRSPRRRIRSNYQSCRPRSTREIGKVEG